MIVPTWLHAKVLKRLFLSYEWTYFWQNYIFIEIFYFILIVFWNYRWDEGLWLKNCHLLQIEILDAISCAVWRNLPQYLSPPRVTAPPVFKPASVLPFGICAKHFIVNYYKCIYTCSTLWTWRQYYTINFA